MRVGDEKNIPAGSAVAAVGAAHRDILFPAKGFASVAAVSAADGNPRVIDEHRTQLRFGGHLIYMTPNELERVGIIGRARSRTPLPLPYAAAWAGGYTE